MAFVINLPGIIPSLEDFKQSAPIGVSPLGTPIFDDVFFPAGSYGGIEYESLRVQSAVISVSQSKNIIKTKVAGRDGTIKEYVSLDDFNISINAKITELANIFPADQLTAWKELAKVSKNIDIISKLLNDYFDIFKVVVESFTVNPVQGSLNEVNLLIELVSDEDINLNDFAEINTSQYL